MSSKPTAGLLRLVQFASLLPWQSLMQWLEWAQRLQAIAQTGLTYARDPFDTERYLAVQRIAAEIMSAGSTTSVQVIDDLFRAQAGYATPKIDVRAAAFNEEHKVLLVREREDSRWTLPGGWADIGNSPSENVIREVLEESGYTVTVQKLAAVYDRSRHAHPPIASYTYKLFFLCRLIGGVATSSTETDSVGFFAEHDLPPLSLTRVIPAQISHMFEHYRHPNLPTTFD